MLTGQIFGVVYSFGGMFEFMAVPTLISQKCELGCGASHVFRVLWEHVYLILAQVDEGLNGEFPTVFWLMKIIFLHVDR